MGILEATRALGAEMQKDERFIAFAKAKLANDNDTELQKQIGEFNIVRMNLEKETSSEEVNEEKVKELNEELRAVYTKIMSSKTMLDYNTAKAGLDAMLNDINSVIMQCALGADPATCEPEHACSGSCDSCGGCH
ncbi:MAG: YlbF family regulator [Clostridia bacterium]|nr:YlbF family regulator [Clostridia bacterium]